MKFWHLSLLLPLVLNCPKQIVPHVETIEIIYLSSLYDDLYRDNPFLAGVQHVEGIKVGHLITDEPFLAILLGRFGFYQLLDEYNLDFVVTDSLVHGLSYFPIGKSMGYGISNYKNIRFAMVSMDQDSLTIADEVTLSLIKQRSDVLWVLDKEFLAAAPQKVMLRITDRVLAETTMISLDVTIDTLLRNKLYRFRKSVDEYLDTKIYLKGKNFNDYILSTIATRTGVNVIAYPETLFRGTVDKDSVSLDEIIQNMSCTARFVKKDITKKALFDMLHEKNYVLWGTIMSQNLAMLPAEGAVSNGNTQAGEYVFDLFYDWSAHAH
jgi:hypothetical protein